MNEKVNLKNIERKAYTSYHQDGILDILIAIFILSVAVWIILDMAWLGWMFYLIAASIYAVAKRAITVPRIGFVKFPQQRYKKMMWVAVSLGVLLNILGLVAFMQTTGGSTPVWLVWAIENYMIVIGLFVAVLFCFVGYTFRARRMYAYALLTLVTFGIGYFMSYPLYYYIILIGTLILLTGLTILIRFVRKYPLQAAS
jgi:hypothetical protein